jgi:PAS domain S-box-containing protein
LTKSRRKRPVGSAPTSEIDALRSRLAESEEALRAIRAGEVDTVAFSGGRGRQVFTLEGAEHAYRTLIESMNEGALTLTSDKTILYANQCFARMVKCPLEQVTGSSFRRFISLEDRMKLRSLMKRADKAGAKIQVLLHRADGSRMSAQISIRPLAKNGPDRAVVGMVVTDMTEARRNEEMMRSLTRRVVQAQEAERGHLALELHDHVTQLLCVVLLRSQALADSLTARDGPAKRAAMGLREMLGRTAEEVERISRGLRPGVLDQLGLAAVLRSTGREFAERTGMVVELTCVELTGRLPADAELALYRVLQEVLRNTEQHARAGHVTVRLTQPGLFVEMSITDDGIGFDPDRRPSGRNGKRGLGLLSMGERAAYVGGVLSIVSAPGEGTTIRARIPFDPGEAGPRGGPARADTPTADRRPPTADRRPVPRRRR